MSRRALGGGLLAAGLLSCGLVPFLGTANAAACPAWTDSATDATLGLPGTSDEGLELVSATLTVSGTDTVATFGVKKLKAGYSGAGDEFSMNMSISGKNIVLYADRLPTGDDAGILNNTDDAAPLGAATAVWDTVKSTVTITAKQADLDAVVLGASSGVTATTLTAKTELLATFQPAVTYDLAIAPGGTAYVVGKPCSGGGGPAPTGTATPTATPTATASATPTPTPTATTPGGAVPDGYPTAGCSTFTDIKGDGTPFVAAPAAFPNEPDLDVMGVAINTTPASILAYLKIDSLKDKPANFQGDRFELVFKVGAKTYTYAVGRMGTGTEITANPTRGQLDGTTNAALKVKGTFDKTNSTVIIEAERAGLNTVNGAPVTDGTTVTGVTIKTVGLQPALQFQADTVAAPAVADQVYTFGDSPCFAPPAAKLANAGATSVQYGDAASVAAKVTSSTGSALAGKNVTFTIGSKSVTAKSGPDGVARAALAPGVTAGSYSVVAAFAGDATASKVSLTTPFTVAVEKTKVALSVAKSGSKRTVTAKLLDDDNHAVAGQTVNWYVNGKKVGSGKTDAAGAVTYVAKAGQTVVAEFLAVTGKYAAGKATQKV
jgi:hypothetical protein